MTSFLLVSALIGATLLVTRSAILHPVRRLFPALLGCSQCTGFWIGGAAGGSGVVVLGRGPLLGAILVGAAISLLALLADGVLLRLLGDPDAPDEGHGS